MGHGAKFITDAAIAHDMNRWDANTIEFRIDGDRAEAEAA